MAQEWGTGPLAESDVAPQRAAITAQDLPERAATATLSIPTADELQVSWTDHWWPADDPGQVVCSSLRGPDTEWGILDQNGFARLATGDPRVGSAPLARPPERDSIAKWAAAKSFTPGRMTPVLADSTHLRATPLPKPWPHDGMFGDISVALLRPAGDGGVGFGRSWERTIRDTPIVHGALPELTADGSFWGAVLCPGATFQSAVLVGDAKTGDTAWRTPWLDARGPNIDFAILSNAEHVLVTNCLWGAAYIVSREGEKRTFPRSLAAVSSKGKRVYLSVMPSPDSPWFLVAMDDAGDPLWRSDESFPAVQERPGQIAVSPSDSHVAVRTANTIVIYETSEEGN